jgi:hypothetical protein
MSNKPPETDAVTDNGHINRAERTLQISAEITPKENEYLTTITSILSKIDMNGNHIIPENNISELIRICLTYTCQVYQATIFADPQIVKKLPNKDAIKEFMAFRKKYMNYPIDAQLTELKRMGIVKAKQEKTG